MSSLIATFGDHETQECRVHYPEGPCIGGGTYNIVPSSPQNTFVKINGKLVLVDGDEFVACCSASLVASTTSFKINGIPVCRDGDAVNSPHSNTGIDVINQSFARSD